MSTEMNTDLVKEVEVTKVKVINTSPTLELPEYGTEYADAVDLRACFDGSETVKIFTEYNEVIHVSKSDTEMVLKPGMRALIPTGIKIELPIGKKASVKPRSGLALKFGITIVNTPGTIDSDYRGDVGVILLNTSKVDFVIKHGERVSQLALEDSQRIEWVDADVVSDSVRGEGGFGHTGKE